MRTESNKENKMETKILDTVELENCKYSHFPNLTPSQFDLAQLGNSLCLKTQNFKLKGFWGENEILYINLVVEMCDYDKNPNYCHSKNEKKQYLGKNIDFNFLATN